MRSVELSGLPAQATPPVQELAGEVVLEYAHRAAIRDPQHLIGGNQVRVRRRAHAGGEHVEELTFGIEHLEAAMTAIDDEQAAVLADLDAVHGVELVRSRLARVFRRPAPV